MNRSLCFATISFAAMTGFSSASLADASRIEKNFTIANERALIALRSAVTPEDETKALAARPDPAAYAKQMWTIISPALKEEWVIEPAAWFLGLAGNQVTNKADGSTGPMFTHEVKAVRSALETQHLKSPNIMPLCLSLAGSGDPWSMGTLEKIEKTNPNEKVKGVAALGLAMSLRPLGDEPEIVKRRLDYLRKAIINSADVEIGKTSVAKLAEDELYIIRFLSKGRVVPDLTGVDSAGKPLKLSDYAGKIVVLLFWNNNLQDAEGVKQISNTLAKRFAGKPFVLLGVNNDSREKLRALQADNSITWPNFSDPENKLANEFRIMRLPVAFVLDGERKIHYAGLPSSFVELTATALVAEVK